MTPATTNAMSSTRSEVSIPGTVRSRTLDFKSQSRPSAWIRLGRKWGCKPETAKDRVYGERGVYQMVADANVEFIADGNGDRVGFLMATIDASLLGETPPLADAINRHNLCDAAEDLAQAEFIRNAGDHELEQWIKKLAGDLHNGEVLLRCLITERDARRGAK